MYRDELPNAYIESRGICERTCGSCNNFVYIVCTVSFVATGTSTNVTRLSLGFISLDR